MLAKTSRVTTADDYRAAVRRGARFGASNTVTYVRRADNGPARFGFIVSKAVGVAVVRNRVRRRLKAVCYSLESGVEPGAQIVIRAQSSAADASYGALLSEVTRSFTKAGVLS